MNTHSATHLIVRATLVIAVGSLAPKALGAGGTQQIAFNGHRLSPKADWPEGLETLLNDPARTNGWNSWFSEWPNDVDHYQFEIKDTAQANKLVEIFSRVQSKSLQIRLSLGREPQSFGWVSKLEEGNNTAVVFSLGSQERINQWFAHLPGGKFGAMEFEKVPVAVPPTLTLFVQNSSIALRQLVIPAHLHVSAGYLPGHFHVSNLKQPKTFAPAAKPVKLDAAAQKATEEIERFISARDAK